MSVLDKFRFLSSIVLALHLEGCAVASTYSAKEIEARVIDADTRQPLEGVNVVAHWVLHFGMEGGQQTDLVLMEAESDKDGRFHFPAWGPKVLPKGLPWEARMKNQDPAILLYKSGYQWRGLSNDRPGPHPEAGPSVRTSDWHGKTIELKKFEGDLKRYGSLVSGVLTGVSYGACNWKQIPRMLMALDKESQWLWRQQIPNYLPTIRKIEGFSDGLGCGSVQEFFREYLR